MRRRLILLYFIVFHTFAAESTRSEVNRFHVLNDRKHTDKTLLQNKGQYLWLDAEISSKLIKLFGEVSNTDSASNEASQTLEVTKLLTGELNTEKYINLHLDLQIPFIPFRYKDFQFLPGVIYETHLGTSISIDNKDDPLVPKAKLYAFMQTRYGIQTLLRHRSIKDGVFKIRIYKNSIKDLSIEKNSTQIASDDSIIDIDELDLKEITYKTDISFQKDKKKYRYIIEARDLKLKTTADSEKESLYGITPLFHFAYQRKFMLGNFIKASSTFGIAHRNRYDISDALYVGLGLDFEKKYPMHIQTKLDSKFLGIWLGTRFKYFHFHYGLKMAYVNPQDDLWVPTIHRINIGIPF